MIIVTVSMFTLDCLKVGNCFEISEFGDRLKSLMVSSVVNIVIHFTGGLRSNEGASRHVIKMAKFKKGLQQALRIGF